MVVRAVGRQQRRQPLRRGRRARAGPRGPQALLPRRVPAGARRAAARSSTRCSGPDDDITLFEYVKRSNRETGPALVGIELGPARGPAARCSRGWRPRRPQIERIPPRQPAVPLPALRLTRRRCAWSRVWAWRPASSACVTSCWATATSPSSGRTGPSPRVCRAPSRRARYGSATPSWSGSTNPRRRPPSPGSSPPPTSCCVVLSRSGTSTTPRSANSCWRRATAPDRPTTRRSARSRWAGRSSARWRSIPSRARSRGSGCGATRPWS